MILDVFQKLLITMMIFLPLEYLLPRLKDKKVFRKNWALDTCYALISGFITTAGIIFIIVVATLLIDPILDPRIKVAIGSQHLILQVLQVIVIADIGYYLIHRMFHENPVLWRLHAIHHSIEEMDWLAAHRVHPFDQILTRGLSLIIPYTFGFSTASIAIFFIIFGWHSYLKHSNINLRFGPLRWLFVTPTFHHWHHANEEHAFDKNYAGQLPILDIIFGTAIMKESKGPEHYGTDTSVPPDFIRQLLLPFSLFISRKRNDTPLKSEDASLPN